MPSAPRRSACAVHRSDAMFYDNVDYSDYPDPAIELAQRGEPSATETGCSSASLPERALLRAVLQEAILDARGYATGMSGTERRRAAQEARDWIRSRSVTWAFSFENVCAILGFDADRLRQWLLHDAPVGQPETTPNPRTLIRGGGMVRAVRAARMRGNQQKQPLKLRRRNSAPRSPAPATKRAVGNYGQ